MIKISLTEENKRQIREVLKKDIHSARARGLVQQLKDGNNYGFIRYKFPDLYQRLYNEVSGEPDKQKIVKYLMCGQKELKELIGKIGSITDKEDVQRFKKIFDYDGFSNRQGARNYLNVLGMKTCPYCNRISVYTENSNHGIKAGMDHYYSEALYPYLSLSVFNLVPCCSYCNSHKNNLDCYSVPILYPYEEEFGLDTYFYIQSKDLDHSFAVFEGKSKEFNILIRCLNDEKKQKIEQQDKRMRLCAVLNDECGNNYKADIQEHIKNSFLLLDNRTNLTRAAVDLSNEEFNNKLDECIENAKKKHRIYEQSDWGNHELAKLYFDIDQQIKKRFESISG